MKNKEFFKEKIFEIACKKKTVAVVNGEPIACEGMPCSKCDFEYKNSCARALEEWLGKDHEEQKIQPEVKSLKKDDRVLVSNDGKIWRRRYFEKYDSNQELVYTYECGYTSWTTYDDYAVGWMYAKLPEEEKEVDWSKIPVDTKIFVKDNKDSRWFRRHFAKYENGKVYAWGNEYTSDQTDDCVWWSYAKLAEGEE